MSEVGSRQRLCVLTVIDALMTAGAETVATRIALGLDSQRFESIICSTRPSPEHHVRAARAEGIEVLELQRRSKLDVWRWRPLVQLLRNGRVDVVHAHKFGSNLWAALLKPRSRLPVLIAHEHSWSYEGTMRRIVDRELIARRADAVSPGCEAAVPEAVVAETVSGPAQSIRTSPRGVANTAGETWMPRSSNRSMKRGRMPVATGRPMNRPCASTPAE